MVARTARAQRARATVILLCAVLSFVPTLGARAEPGDLDQMGAIELLETRNGRTRISGWVAAPGPRAPAVRVVLDGRAVPLFRPTDFRFDMARATPHGDGVWGWDLQLDREFRSGLCISAVVDGAHRGLECRSRTDDALLPAVGGGTLLGSSGPLIRYSVEAEAATGVHPEEFAREVDAVLADPRSWAANGDARFKRVRPALADLRITLATPATTDRMCLPFRTGGQLSCNKGDELIVFNISRWRDGVPHWTAPLAEYRAYLVNHEVGHSLDFRHIACSEPGTPAPLMMQQTKSLDGCLPNGWPYLSAPTCQGEPATIVARPGETVVGTSGDDVIVGTPDADEIRGGPGDDTICGLGGADTIRGNAGADEISGGPGRDRLWGGKGRDELRGNGARDTIRGGPGTDTCLGGPGTDDIRRC